MPPQDSEYSVSSWWRRCKVQGARTNPFRSSLACSDGILCDPTGGALTKPSTPAEIAFYQSCEDHPRLRGLMPRMLGVLDELTVPPVAETETATGAGTSTLPSKGSGGAEEKNDRGPDGGVTLTAFPGNTPALKPTNVSPGCGEGSVVQSTLTDTISVDETTTTTTTKAKAESTTVAAAAATQEEETQDWAPSHGRKITSNTGLVMEDIAYPFERPTILDIKLGARLWADDAPPTKKIRLDEVSASTTSSSLGLRIAGMKVWLGGKGEQVSVQHGVDAGDDGSEVDIIEVEGYKKFDRWYGRSFNAENVQEGFETFLSSAKSDTWDGTKIVAQRIARGIRDIEEALGAEESRMYSSSILIVYEGDPEALQHALAEEKEREKEAESLEALKKSLAEESKAFKSQKQEEVPKPKDLDVSTLEFDGTFSGEDDDDDAFSAFDISDDDEKLKALDVRLIDFAHASWTPGLGPDGNVLHGVRNAARLFENIASGESRPLEVKCDASLGSKDFRKLTAM